MRREDKYLNFAKLSRDEVEGQDYQINLVRIQASDIAILAPHGGKIEPLTSNLARSIAGNDYSFYVFEGIKQANNWDLHIASTRFDEPNALELISHCRRILTIHGWAATHQRSRLAALMQDCARELMRIYETPASTAKSKPGDNVEASNLVIFATKERRVWACRSRSALDCARLCAKIDNVMSVL